MTTLQSSEKAIQVNEAEEFNADLSVIEDEISMQYQSNQSSERKLFR